MSLTPDRVQAALRACAELTIDAPVTPERFRQGVLRRAFRVLHAPQLTAVDLWHCSALLAHLSLDHNRQETMSLANRFLVLARYADRGLTGRDTSVWRDTEALLDAEILRLAGETDQPQETPDE